MARTVLESGSFREIPHSVWNATYVEQKTFLERNLQEETEYIKENWHTEDLPENWVDLPGIGFMIGYQMGFLDSEKFQPFSLEERVEKWTKLTKYSLKSWVMEYLAGRGVLPGLQTLEFEEGRWKYKDDLHGAGLELNETLSKKEANGLVWDMYANTIKPYFVSGTSAITYSPSGKRMPNEDGIMIDYPDSRHTFMEKRGKYIFTYTIANDFEPNEHAELANELQKLGVQNPYTFTNESIAEDFIAHPTLFSTPGVKLSHILSLMGNIREKNGKKYVYKEKTASDLIAESLSWESMWDYDDVAKRFVEEFVDFSLAKSWTKETLKEALSVTILRLSKYVKNKEEAKQKIVFENRSGVSYQSYGQDSYTVTNHNYYTYTQYSGGNYGQTFRKVAATPGCAGGGQSSYSDSYETSYETIIAGTAVEKECVHCPFCEQSVTAIYTPNKIICKSCRKSADRKPSIQY